jgi:ABC-2 type transport system ATP-binding protein
VSKEDALSLSGIVKSYRKVRALRGLDLTVPRGESFSLLGPNGAGKSTLMKIILSLVRADSGEAFISGIPVGSPAARRGVRYLPENISFPQWATPMILFRQLERIRREVSREEFLERCAELDCADLAGRPVGKMSYGQRQRVALSLVTAGRPEMVFLDEPSNGLDPAGRIVVRNLIRNLSSAGVTVMLNSHLLGEVERTCGSAAFISRGRLIAQGDIDSLSRQKGLALIETQDSPAMTEALLSAGYGCSSADRGVTAEMADPEGFRRLCAVVLETGVPFSGVSLQREDLEEVFLRIMGADGSKEAGDVS